MASNLEADNNGKIPRSKTKDDKLKLFFLLVDPGLEYKVKKIYVEIYYGY